MGLWNWGEKIFNAGEKILNAIVTVTDVAIDASFKIAEGINTVIQGTLYVGQCLFFPSAFHTALWNLGSFLVRNTFNILLTQPLHAIRDMVPTSALQEIYNSRQTQAFLATNLPTNLIILGLVLLQQELFASNEEDEQSHMNFVRDLYMTQAAGYILWAITQRIKLHNAVDRVATNLALTDSIVKREKNELNKYFEPCKHNLSSVDGAVGLVKSYVEYPITILGRALQLFALSYVVDEDNPWTYYPYMILVCMDEGQSVWSYKLDSAGICSTDQQHWFNANNTYFTAWGALFRYLTYLASQGIMQNNPAVFAVVRNMLYPLFIVSTLTVTMPPPNKPAEGKKLDGDPFEPGREALKYLIKKGAQIADYCIDTSKEGNAMAVFLNAVNNVPPYVVALFLDKDLSTPRKAVTERKSINKLIEISGADWRSGIETFKRYTNVPGASFVPTVTHLIPSFVMGSKVIQFGADTIFGRDLRPPLRWIDHEISEGLKAAKKREKQRLIHEGKSKVIDSAPSSNPREKWIVTEINSDQGKDIEPSSNEVVSDNVAVVEAKTEEKVEAKHEESVQQKYEEKVDQQPVEKVEVKQEKKVEKPCEEKQTKEGPLNTHAACIKKLSTPENSDWVLVPITHAQPVKSGVEQPVQSSSEGEWIVVRSDTSKKASPKPSPNLFLSNKSNLTIIDTGPTPIPTAGLGARAVSKAD